jgi:O-antigen/teichoic acid export membrane protein
MSKQSHSNSFWRNVASVFTGTAVAQAIPVLGSLVIARQYLPADFGIFSAWLGLVMLLAVVLSGRFETVLAIEADGEPRHKAFISTLATIMLTSLIAGCLLAAFYAFGLERQVAWMSHLSITMAVALVPTSLSMAVSETWQSLAASEGKYRQLSIMRIAQTAGIVVFQIIGGQLFGSASALAIGHLLGVWCGISIAWYMLPLGKIPDDFAATLKAFWIKHQRFPRLSLPADAINTAAGQLPILMVTSRFSPELAGYLALTMKVLGAPIGLLGRAVLDVFKRHAASSYRERGECRSDYLETLRVLAAGSLLFCVFMYFASETLFGFAFGSRWRDAGSLAVIFLPMFAMRFVASPLSYIVYIANKQHMDLLWQICLLVVTVVSLGVPIDPHVSLRMYSYSYSVLYVVYLAMSYKFSLGENR